MAFQRCVHGVADADGYGRDEMLPPERRRECLPLRDFDMAPGTAEVPDPAQVNDDMEGRSALGCLGRDEGCP